jgi:hypothetical protein
MRSSNPFPWKLLQPLWGCDIRPFDPSHLALCLAIPVSLVTLALQVSSTIIFSDLSLGLLPGNPHTESLAADYFYLCLDGLLEAKRATPSNCDIITTHRVPGSLETTIWPRSPSFYPTFVKYAEGRPSGTIDGVSNTCVLLRDFLPHSDAQS